MSAANRGLTGGGRKRSREPDDDIPSSSAVPPSSPPPSSPPVLPLDDEDDAGPDPDADLIGDIDDADEMAEDEDGIDLFADNFERDYRARENDAYVGADIDDEGDYDELDPAARRQLEARLNKRDRELARRRRMPAAFLDEEDEAELDLTRQPRRRRHHYDEEREDEEMADDIMEEELSLETLQDVKASSLTEWVSQPSVYRTIFREFKSFLTEYTDENGTSVYGTRVRTLGEINAESLEVSYDHLSACKAILAYFLANAPGEVLKIFDQFITHYANYGRHISIAWSALLEL
ncbi:MAG: hypothetical protein Q9214_006975 [Letrouitia sp. 1 TL-2023]